MASGELHVVFRGELTGELPEETVKDNLAQLFHQPRERIEALFGGRTVVVKKGVDADTARRFEAAFRKAGAVCELQRADGGGATPGAGRGDAAAASTAAATGATGAAGDPNRTAVPLAVPDDLGGLELDDSGAPLTPPTERTPPQIDTAGLALSDDETPAGRQRDRDAPDIDTGDLELEPGPGEGR